MPRSDEQDCSAAIIPIPAQPHCDRVTATPVTGVVQIEIHSRIGTG